MNTELLTVLFLLAGAILMFALNREQGTTLVLVTHDRQLAARCERSLVIQAGRLSEATAQP